MQGSKSRSKRVSYYRKSSKRFFPNILSLLPKMLSRKIKKARFWKRVRLKRAFLSKQFVKTTNQKSLSNRPSLTIKLLT